MRGTLLSFHFFVFVSLSLLNQLFICREGSKIIWIAPSGGRDRPDVVTGEWYPVSSYMWHCGSFFFFFFRPDAFSSDICTSHNNLLCWLLFLCFSHIGWFNALCCSEDQCILIRLLDFLSAIFLSSDLILMPYLISFVSFIWFCWFIVMRVPFSFSLIWCKRHYVHIMFS